MLGGHRVDEFIHQAGSDDTLGTIGRGGQRRQQDPLIPLRCFIIAHPSSTFPVEIVLVRNVLKMTLGQNPLGHAGIIGVSHVP